MKTIGLLGGMSWQSTQSYYQLINQGVNQALGGLHSAKILLNSLDFAPIAAKQSADDWDALADQLIQGALALQSAGADCLVIGTNTMHKVADQVQQAIDIELLHIADATAEHLKRQGINSTGLLGTAFTMEQRFYRDRLAQQGLRVWVPEPEDRQRIHQVIYQELCQGQIHAQSQADFLAIIHKLAHQGAEAVILGCTEIGLLVNQSQTHVKLLDTTAIHAQSAVEFSLKG